jgi:hypothetical protein
MPARSRKAARLFTAAAYETTVLGDRFIARR